MTRFSPIGVLTVLALTCASAGCGSDSGNNKDENGNENKDDGESQDESKNDSQEEDDTGGVPGDTKLSSLTEADAKALCLASLRASTKAYELDCSYEGARFHDDVTSCETIRDNCLKFLSTGCDAGDLAERYVGCEATVSELRACGRGQTAEKERAFSGLSCASDAGSFAIASDGIQQPEACEQLANQCPTLFGGE